MTRSLGDMYLKQSGVISTPEVLKHEITKDDQFMIIASDGIWEHISN